MPGTASKPLAVPSMPREVVIDGVRYAPVPDEVKIIKANPCRVCLASATACERDVQRKHRGCCMDCYRTDTHDMTLDDWATFRSALRSDGAEVPS